MDSFQQIGVENDEINSLTTVAEVNGVLQNINISWCKESEKDGINLLTANSSSSWYDLVDQNSPQAAFAEGEHDGAARWLQNIFPFNNLSSNATKGYAMIKSLEGVLESIRAIKSQLIGYINCQDNFGSRIKFGCDIIANDNVKLIASHHHCEIVSVATNNDVIKIFGFERFKNLSLTLKEKSQADIKCLAWRPFSSLTVAAACNQGIYIWDINPNTAKTRPRAAMSKHLTQKGHSPVTAIDWSPDGIYIVSAANRQVLVWNYLNKTACKLHSVTSGTSMLRWSPCNRMLFSSSLNAPTFRIWTTNNWQHETWSTLNKQCKTTCWSHCGRFLLFTIDNDPSIYHLRLESVLKSKSSTTGAGACNTYSTKVFDTTTLITPLENSDQTIGGNVHMMLWDSSSSRLAVSFQDAEHQSIHPYIALFKTRLDPIFEVIPCGLIVNCGETPLTMSYVNGSDNGALLAVCWSNHRLATVPMQFESPSHRMTMQHNSMDTTTSNANGIKHHLSSIRLLSASSDH